jgi:hypothetical protein
MSNGTSYLGKSSVVFVTHENISTYPSALSDNPIRTKFSARTSLSMDFTSNNSFKPKPLRGSA